MKPIEFKADDDKKDYSFKVPKSFELTGTWIIPEDSPLLKWAMAPPKLDPKKVLKQTEKLMKKFNILPENITADRNTLNWLFLNSKETE